MNAHRIASLRTPRLLVVGLLFFTACQRQVTTTSPAPQPQRTPAPRAVTTAGALVDAMRARYPDWYRTLTFVQKTTIYRPNGGELTQTWYEAASLPGGLRIDTDLAAKSGTLFARDSIFAVAGGKLVRADTGLNELLVLGFDLYTQSTARSEAQLRRLGFDLSRIHEDTWQGKPVYVVGAERGDTVSKQFWIDRENLLFVRLIERGRQGRVEVRFDKYIRLGQGWLAMEVVQLVNGKPTLREEYSDPHANPSLSPALFDAKQWSSVPHWTKAGSTKP